MVTETKININKFCSDTRCRQVRWSIGSDGYRDKYNINHICFDTECRQVRWSIWTDEDKDKRIRNVNQLLSTTDNLLFVLYSLNYI